MNSPLHKYNDAQPFITEDGSEIRELLHPKRHGNRQQSLAEATVYSGRRTALHRHLQSEEIYHFLAGQGTMTLGEQNFPVGPGDTVLIPPGTPHRLHNTWPMELRVLCCCSPAYAPADTEILEAAD